MKRIAYLVIIVTTAISCRKPYNPPAITSNGNYLVVEGVINASGVTTIKLSRTVNVSNNNPVSPVTGAVVTIESSQNNTYPLPETSAGAYKSDSLGLNSALQYRLSIKTSDNKQYLSDFEAVKITPPIDSIGFNIDPRANNMQVYINTHDPNNDTRYYRWSYEEAWKFHSKFLSTYITNGVQIVPRLQSQFKYYCFAADTSSDIVLGSSAKLVNDLIYQNTVTTIPSTSEKIMMEYSIQVHEYAITGKAYNFWINLKKNTEQLGSIFDAQPSNINGNIHNVNNLAEPVIGFISACTVQTKRVFIQAAQLPQSWRPVYPYDCSLDSQYFAEPHGGFNDVQYKLIPLGSEEIPTDKMYYKGVWAGYLSSSGNCVDCTFQGSLTQPPFWK